MAKPNPIRCIRCENALENIQPDTGFQPNDGLAFYTTGHYGSTFFDPVDGTYIEVAVCDPCMKHLTENGFVYGPKGQPRRPGEW